MSRNLLSIFAILFTVFLSAQVPQGVSYQAIALNGSGNAVVSSNVGVRLSILDNSATGAVLYTESHTKTTNAQGLFNLIIGQGTPSAGIFATINWAVNSKFLKVEMDTAGGTNYVLVGTTQLLSVPYALAAKSLTLAAGEGITLTSPNGTQYVVGVNDAGQLTLPTSGATGNDPSNLYLYGSFNSFNPATALLTSTVLGFGIFKYGYKYLTGGTEIKYVSQNVPSTPVYGFDGSLFLILNGSAYTIPSDGFYYLNLAKSATPGDQYNLSATSIAPQINLQASVPNIFPTYNSATNTFTFIVNGITSSSPSFEFDINHPTFPMFGDNLADGTIDHQGAAILFPNTTAAPKNYKVDLVLNFNGSGNYVITEL